MALKNHQAADAFVNQYPIDLTQLKCEVFPPLLVRYGGEEDTFIPVKLTISGEMHKTLETPDMILNFHADSKAITLTMCDLDKNNLSRYNVAVDALYAMRMPIGLDGLSLIEFASLYDEARAPLLKNLLAKK
jgi:hypothetical protein